MADMILKLIILLAHMFLYIQSKGTDCDTDINECLETNRCGDEYKICVNSIGSYTCSCIPGYTLTNDGTCIGM